MLTIAVLVCFQSMPPLQPTQMRSPMLVTGITGLEHTWGMCTVSAGWRTLMRCVSGRVCLHVCAPVQV